MKTSCLLGLAVCVLGSQLKTGAAGTIPQEAYVWQRAWTEPVRESVQAHAGAFSNLVLLAAEVSWQDDHPRVTRVALPWKMLSQIKTPLGLALRIGPFGGPFSEYDATAGALAALAASLVDEARSNGAGVLELQIDFDCAESKLDGYREWVVACKRAVAPVPLTITALPSWLGQPAFRALAAAADGYVLQVHSLVRPKSFDAPFSLCDPAAARAAVRRAGEIGVPFRVALPTYGYLLAFAPDGRFVGLSAESPAQSWPANARLREVRADATAISALVQEWAAQRPPALRGIIWYRLPMEGDILNWRWPTLDAMLQLRSPREHVRAASRRVESGLLEISLVNDGELDISSRLAVTVHWQDARLQAGDALRGFELVEEGPLTAKFQSRSPPRLRAGDTWTLGWLRLNKDAGVTLELSQP